MALIAEGEKDAFNLQKVAAQFSTENDTLTYAATTNIGGAGKWLDSYSPYLTGKRVFVFLDNDDAGRKHAQQVCASVSKYAQAVHLVELPGLAEHGDVSDYLEKHNPGELFKLIRVAQVWTTPAITVEPTMMREDAARITEQLLNLCQSWIHRYIIVSEDQAVIMATWILHTYALDAAETTPYIHIAAPEKECGKSYLMEVLAGACRRARPPRRDDSRRAGAHNRNQKANDILDEMDAQLGANKEYVETDHGILNQGFRRGGKFYKCNATTHEVEEINAYCPKCFAGMGQSANIVASRSIRIEMQRKLPGKSVEPLRQKAVRKAALPIKTDLEAWKERGAADLLSLIEPAPIAGLGDRQNDIAEPLLAIAQLAGERWLQRLTVALQSVFNAAKVEDGSIGVTLLSDIRTVFDERGTGPIPSKELAALLCQIEGRPWAEWSHGKGLTANTLAGQLKKYGIHPHSVRVEDKTPKGYQRCDFEDSWGRYCVNTPLQNATTPQPASLLAETAFSDRNTLPSVAVAKNTSNPHEQKNVAAVAVENQKSPDSELRI